MSSASVPGAAGGRQRAVRLGPSFLMTDEEAMSRVQNDGDAGAFALLVRRWRPRIRRLCTRMVGDAHLAEDLTQETFARLFTRRDTYRGDGRFGTFLWRIALNLCADERRRARRRPEVSLSEQRTEAEALADPGESPAASLLAAERAERVRRAVVALPEHYRAVVVLRHYEGLKFRQIAEVLGIPLGTVKSRMAEALNRLVAPLEPELLDP